MLNLVNEEFGRLRVLQESDGIYSGNKRYRLRRNWLCLCDPKLGGCGNRIIVLQDSLKGNKTKSCGCLYKEKNCYIKHGLSYTYLYNIWYNIKRRCYDEDNLGYKNYGERGIKMYIEWLDNPEAFCIWIEQNLGPRLKGYSLDRIDNDGNYEPGNLRWATKSEQQYNKRKKFENGLPNK